MLSPGETAHIRQHAYLPEHVVPYVTSVSGAEPFLTGDFLCYLAPGTLIFVGYPLQGDFSEQTFLDGLHAARKRWRPETLSVIAPAAARPLETCSRVSSDHYYACSLPRQRVQPKLANMVRRASVDVTVTAGRAFSESHLTLIRDFLLTRPLDDATKAIFQRLPEYVAASETAVVFSARRPDGTLVAFSIGEYWGARTAMYMFNVTSRRNYVPGTSDLLLSALLLKAESKGQTRANLGLGINEGVTFFKRKWGAEKLCEYHHYACREKRRGKLSAILRGVLSR